MLYWLAGGLLVTKRPEEVKLQREKATGEAGD